MEVPLKFGVSSSIWVKIPAVDPSIPIHTVRTGYDRHRFSTVFQYLSANAIQHRRMSAGTFLGAGGGGKEEKEEREKRRENLYKAIDIQVQIRIFK